MPNLRQRLATRSAPRLPPAPGRAPRLRAIGGLGLQAYPTFAESYASLDEGSLCVYAREARMVPKGIKPALIQSLVGAVHLGTRSATFRRN